MGGFSFEGLRVQGVRMYVSDIVRNCVCLLASCVCVGSGAHVGLKGNVRLCVCVCDCVCFSTVCGQWCLCGNGWEQHVSVDS